MQIISQINCEFKKKNIYLEISSKAEYSVHSDMFAFGVLMWEIVSRNSRPFQGIEGFAIAALIQQGQRPEIPNDCPLDLKNLIKSCWSQEPKQRPTTQQVIEYLETLKHLT